MRVLCLTVWLVRWVSDTAVGQRGDAGSRLGGVLVLQGSVAMAEGERMCWGSEGGWGLACSHPRFFREALPPLCCLLQ